MAHYESELRGVGFYPFYFRIYFASVYMCVSVINRHRCVTMSTWEPEENVTFLLSLSAVFLSIQSPVEARLEASKPEQSCLHIGMCGHAQLFPYGAWKHHMDNLIVILCRKYHLSSPYLWRDRVLL